MVFRMVINLEKKLKDLFVSYKLRLVGSGRDYLFCLFSQCKQNYIYY